MNVVVVDNEERPRIKLYVHPLMRGHDLHLNKIPISISNIPMYNLVLFLLCIDIHPLLRLPSCSLKSAKNF